MTNNKENKPLPKWFIYTLFVLKFILGLGLIYWTIYMTLQSDVGSDADNAFLSEYHSVDNDYNKMMEQNDNFSKKYNIKFLFNDNEIIGLSHKDVFLPQRAIRDRKIRKDFINIGKNEFKVLVQDKNGNKIKNHKVNMLVTKAVTHKDDVKLSFNNKSKEFTINSIGYWNITGTVEIGDEKGYFFIKTNAKK